MHYRKPYFLFIFEYDSKKGHVTMPIFIEFTRKRRKKYAINEISCLAYKTHCLKIKLREIRIQQGGIISLITKTGYLGAPDGRRTELPTRFIVLLSVRPHMPYPPLTGIKTTFTKA